VNYDAWNRYVLIAIGLFAGLLYLGLLYAGIAAFRSGLALKDKPSRRWRNRCTPRKLRNRRVSAD
jgi:hypothetical protein